jgi:hypothetical protein
VCSLLALIVAYDSRKVGSETIAAWQEVSIRARWSFPEAREAVLEHFATNAEYLKPAHVTQYIRARQQAPPPIRELPAPPKPPADPQHIRAVLTHLGKRLGWPERHGAASAELTVQCPHCGAAAGRPCARQLARGHRRGQWVRTSTHRSRLDLVKDDA